MSDECRHSWETTDVYCEYCGSHPAIVCIKCDETRDVVGDPEAFDIYAEINGDSHV